MKTVFLYQESTVNVTFKHSSKAIAGAAELVIRAYLPEGAALPSTRLTSCLASPGGVGRGPGALLLDALGKGPLPAAPAKGLPPKLLCISCPSAGVIASNAFRL